MQEECRRTIEANSKPEALGEKEEEYIKWRFSMDIILKSGKRRALFIFQIPLSLSSSDDPIACNTLHRKSSLISIHPKLSLAQTSPVQSSPANPTSHLLFYQA